MKFNVKQVWKARKNLILSVVAGVIAVAVGCSIWYYMGHNSADPVYVYPFQYIGMTEYWGDSQESHGPVTTDKIQTVFLTDTQTVTEILVQEGDAVKKGDLLMTFDTTLSDLQLERKRLDVEKKKLQLENAKKELRRINSMKPMVTPSYEDDDVADVYLGRPISDIRYEISNNKAYDGSTAAKAIICWIHSDKEIDDSVFLDIQDKVSYYQYLNRPAEDPEEDNDETGDGSGTDGGENGGGENGGGDNTGDGNTDGDNTDGGNTGGDNASGGGETPENNQQVAGNQEPSSASEFSYPLVNSFHVIFKVTSGNMSLAEKVTWQGVRATDTGSYFTFRFETAVAPDHMLVDMGGGGEAEDVPQIDLGSGYTAAQIAQMRSDQQKKIKDLEFQIKMADAEYRIMQTEAGDGNVYAQIDGKVVSCLTEEEAKKTRQPVLKVSGGGGFFVEGFVSELEKDNMKIGQEVTINDWNSGMTYMGSIVSVGDFPKQNDYYGNGNPNASFYPFKVFVDEEADLQAGSYVSVVYSAAESENGIYLENPFLRTENGKSYVLVLGSDGKLEQRFVTTGKSLWGNYTQILTGLTADDFIAFPYGKTVKPGVPAVEGDMANLYGG